MKLRPSRRDLITGAAALAAYSRIGDVEAVNRLLLMSGGVPHFPGATVDMNFAAGQYYGGSLSSLISVSRASGGYATNADGSLTYFGNNVPRIGNGTGLLIEQASTNLIYPSVLATNIGGGFSSVTPNAGIAPDQTNTASNYIWSSIVNAYSQPSSVTNTANVPYTGYMFIKANVASGKLALHLGKGDDSEYAGVNFNAANNTASLLLNGSDVSSASYSLTSLANGWFFISVTATFANSYSSNFTLTLSANLAPGNALVWGLGLEQNSVATSYIPTTSGTVARAADNITASGFLQTALAGAQGSVYAATGPVGGVGGISQGIVYQSGRELLTVQSNTQIGMFNGSTALQATLGSGNYNANVLQASGWNSTGRSVVGNLGTVATDTNPVGTVSGNYFLGSVNAATRFINGYLQRLAVWQNRLSDATLRALT